MGDGSERVRTVASTEAGGDNLDLSLVWTWRPEGALFIAKVFGAVKNGGVLCLERSRRHGRGDGKLRIKLTTVSTVFKVCGYNTSPHDLEQEARVGPIAGGGDECDRGVFASRRDNYGAVASARGQSLITHFLGMVSGANFPVTSAAPLVMDRNGLVQIKSSGTHEPFVASLVQHGSHPFISRAKAF